MDFNTDFDESDKVKGSLMDILKILGDKEVDENILHSVTLPACLWFDTMQALAMAGGMLTKFFEFTEPIADSTPQLEALGLAIEKAATIYNEVYDSLVRLSEQVTK